MMKNNYDYTKSLLHYCLERKIAYLYASSASVYGGGSVFKESREFEEPLNMYAYSKFLFDQYVRRHQAEFKSQVVGFRYFNVYGPREQHKGSMSSVAFHVNTQIHEPARQNYSRVVMAMVMVSNAVTLSMWVTPWRSISGLWITRTSPVFSTWGPVAARPSRMWPMR